jgi:formylglycine-generating enzyme required for sulfatase activity
MPRSTWPGVVGLCGLPIALGALVSFWSTSAAFAPAPVSSKNSLPLSKAGKNSIGMEFKPIPKGTFTMGSPETDKPRSDNEKEHEVKIERAFYLGRYEVTQKQFKAAMGFNPSHFSTDGKGDGGNYKYDQPAGGKDEVEGMDTSDFPVENVSYHEAVKFCDKLNELEKKTLGAWKYSLPTEAQWEYACRGGASSNKKYHFGDSISYKQANYDYTDNLGRTCRVGSYDANGFGLHDMHGNVWEWCLDWYDKDYKGADKDFKGSLRVLRGGCWCNSTTNCRSADRAGRNIPETRTGGSGFRVALVPTR